MVGVFRGAVLAISAGASAASVQQTCDIEMRIRGYLLTQATSENLQPVKLGGAQAWFVYSLSALAFGYAFFQRVAPSVMVSDLMADFAIGGGMLGVLSALYFYPYVILQIPLGALLDRLGARWLLVIALSFAGVGSILFGAAQNLPMAYLGRMMVGAGSAVGFLGSLALAARWFPPNRFAMLAGMTMFFGMTSGVVAQGPLALFVETFGWRAAQWNLGLFALALAAIVFFFVRNGPVPRDRSTYVPESWGSIFKSIAKAGSRRDVWSVAFVAAAMSGPMLTLGGLWGTPYVMSAYGLERPQAAFLVSLMLFGWAVAAPFSGWLSDRLQMRKRLLVLACAVMSLSLAVLVFLPNLSIIITVGMLIIAGISGSFMSVTFALVREVVPENLTGSSLGIVNGMTVASGAVLQPVVGFALDTLSSGIVVDGSAVYTAQDYRMAFGSILVVVLLGFLVALTLKDGELRK